MIKKITMKNVASYKSKAELNFEDGKRCCLIYGLNGVGKSTLSTYLYYYKKIQNFRRDRSSDTTSEIAKIKAKYDSCGIALGNEIDDELIVYNRDFIRVNFTDRNDDLDGVATVTIGEENNDAETNISNANAEIERIRCLIAEIDEEIQAIKKERSDSENTRKDNVTKQIKRMATEALLVEKIGKQSPKIWSDLKKALDEEPRESLEGIKNKLSQIKDNTDPIINVNIPTLILTDIEGNSIWEKVNNNSSSSTEYSNIIGYSEWLNQGLTFLNGKDDDCMCPFCNSGERKNLRLFVESLVGEEYKQSIREIEKLYNLYIQQTSDFLSCVVILPEIIDSDLKLELNKALERTKNVIRNNISSIDRKKAHVMEIISLEDSSEAFEVLQEVLTRVNEKINEYNEAISNQKEFIEECLKQFWCNMRHEFADELRADATEDIECERHKEEKETQKNRLKTQIDSQEAIINENSQKRFDIAYEKINEQLKDFGINGFELEMIDGRAGSYKLVRPDQNEEDAVYKSLSEGEKTMISFLYFIQVCQGADKLKKKIIVIDDPITSMSNRFLFNISSLIQREFTNTAKYKQARNYEQVVILTHNLNFFNELLHPKKETSEKFQQLVRIVKRDGVSDFKSLGYSEIQNDYQAHWTEIKEEKTNYVVLLNSMRSIIEHFFGMTEKKTISEVFDDDRVSSARFDSFKMFINNGSHGSITNVTDSSEFSYEDILNDFEELFNAMGYSKHYKEMMS